MLRSVAAICASENQNDTSEYGQCSPLYSRFTTKHYHLKPRRDNTNYVSLGKRRQSQNINY